MNILDSIEKQHMSLIPQQSCKSQDSFVHNFAKLIHLIRILRQQIYGAESCSQVVHCINPHAPVASLYFPARHAVQEKAPARKHCITCVI